MKKKKPVPKPTPRPYVWLCAAMFVATPVAAQSVGSAEECAAFADMAIVTSALAKAGVKEPVMRGVIADIYNTVEAHAPMVDALIAKSYASKIKPKDFAGNFGKHCLANQGKMEGFFGTAL